MIDFIEGSVADLNPAWVVIEVNGIGYKLNISLNCYEQLLGKSKCRLLTQLVVRDDGFDLYGFIDSAERELFMLLRSVSKIGPNLSRVILSSMKPSEIVEAIINNNTALISSIKGIGQKTAQRIVVELKDNMEKCFSVAKSSVDLSSGKGGIRNEAVTALVTLGFGKAAAEAAVDKQLADSSGNSNVEELIKEALKRL
jgi:holliday junction DNA helicase RuvA